MKIVAATVLLLLVAGIGVAYAAQWHPMMNLLGGFRGNSTNATGMWARFMGNPMNTTGNYTAKYQQFIQAFSNNDYATAQQLNQEYGFGGKIFDKLNATTFSQLSQIYTLSTELRKELGINGTRMGMGMMGFGNFGNMNGTRGGMPFAQGFVNGFRAGRFVGAHNRHGRMNETNSSAT